MAEQYDENCAQEQTGKRENAEIDLTFTPNRAIIPSDQPNVNLDNGISVQPTVQANREFMTTNGCRVRMLFKTENDPTIRKEIARLLLAAFEQERNADDETSHVSVQGIDERAG